MINRFQALTADDNAGPSPTQIQNNDESDAFSKNNNSNQVSTCKEPAPPPIFVQGVTNY